MIFDKHLLKLSLQGDSIAKKYVNQRNIAILHGLNLGHRRARIFKKITPTLEENQRFHHRILLNSSRQGIYDDLKRD